ncbi:hypothetical protein C8R47DRAFT_1273220 [Mycena vitilis]|nr:hypothetical protein C8R47DRAFT_1273220 [Mycena vitilis]
MSIVRFRTTATRNCGWNVALPRYLGVGPPHFGDWSRIHTLVLPQDQTTVDWTISVGQLQHNCLPACKQGSGRSVYYKRSGWFPGTPNQLSEFASEVAIAGGPIPTTGHGPPIAAIVGSVVGALAVLLLLLIIFLRRRWRRRNPPAPVLVAPHVAERSHPNLPTQAKGPSVAGSRAMNASTAAEAGLSIAPTHGAAPESGSMGPPPEYHN